MRLNSRVGRECEGQFDIFCNSAGKILICISCQLLSSVVLKGSKRLSENSRERQCSFIFRSTVVPLA